MSAGFLVLVAAQCAHSVEECIWRLYEVFAPARMISGLVSSDLALGFAMANTAIVVFGVWCWWKPVRSGWPSAPAILWGWTGVEVANGTGHILMAIARGGYFPGAATAPLLLAAAGRLAALPMRASSD